MKKSDTDNWAPKTQKNESEHFVMESITTTVIDSSIRGNPLCSALNSINL
jgi:hypothetical protein